MSITATVTITSLEPLEPFLIIDLIFSQSSLNRVYPSTLPRAVKNERIHERAIEGVIETRKSTMVISAGVVFSGNNITLSITNP
ncbi:MAG: hypothetical protein Q6352_009390 [Candidatus Freyrarchaeum guaymaensis]